MRLFPRRSESAMMNSIQIQKCAKCIAYVFAGLGICAAAAAIYPFFVPGTELWLIPRWFVSFPLLVIAPALLRASYLVLFRWSPLAVLHLVGGAYFFATILFIPVVMFFQITAYRVIADGGGYMSFMALPFALPLTFPGYIGLSYVLYRCTASRLSRRFFPKVSHDGEKFVPRHS